MNKTWTDRTARKEGLKSAIRRERWRQKQRQTEKVHHVSLEPKQEFAPVKKSTFGKVVSGVKNFFFRNKGGV